MDTYSRNLSCGRSVGYAYLLLGFAIVSTQAAASDKNQQPNSSDQKVDRSAQAQSALDEVIVTAQKRQQSLQSVAAAVSAFSGEVIEENGIKNVLDLSAYTPGLIVSNNGAAGRVYIRGVGNNLDFLGSHGAVAIHLDGVYQSRPWGVFYDFTDVERIEVMRGPQGTLYGRNATGGAINVISEKPADELAAGFNLSVGNYEALNFEGSISSEIADNVAGRLSVSRKSRAGYTNNLFPGMDDLDDEDLWTLRGEIKFQLNDTAELRVLGHYLFRDVEGQAFVPSSDGLASTLGAQSNIDPFEVSHDINTFYQAKNTGVTAIAAWRIGDKLTLHSISAYGENDISGHVDTDGTELNAVNFINSEDHTQLNQELRLLGNAAHDKLEWQSGLYYLREETSDSGTVFLPAFGFDIPVAGGIDVEAFAVFAQGSYSLTERLGLTIGLRYNTERKDVSSAVIGNDQTTWHDWTPHVALEFQATERAFLYASITKGFKSGGYNVLVGPEVVSPEYVWSYELGSKADWLDNRLRLNSSVFYARYTDQQVNTFTGAGLARLENAAKSTIYGLELEAFATPTDALNFAATFSYLNAEFDEFVAADPFLGAVNLAGSTMSNAPKFSFSLSADYVVPTGFDGATKARISYLWRDDVKYDVFDDPGTTQDAYGTIDASISHERPNQHWKVVLWAKNLNDQTYYTSQAKLNFSPTGVISWTGQPRTFGLRYSYDF